MKITPLLVTSSALLALVGAFNVSHAQSDFDPNPTVTPTPSGTMNDRFDSNTTQSQSYDSGSTLTDDNVDTVGENRFADDGIGETNNRDSANANDMSWSEDRVARADRN